MKKIRTNKSKKCRGFKKKVREFIKGDGGDVLFDVGGGSPAFIFGSNLPIFWLHASLVIEIPKIKSNGILMTSNDL